MEINNKLYEEQIEFIDEVMELINSHYKEKREDPEYREKFEHIFHTKHIPDFLYQNLKTFRTKIEKRPIRKEIMQKYDINSNQLDRLLENYTYSELLKGSVNVEKIFWNKKSSSCQQEQTFLNVLN